MRRFEALTAGDIDFHFSPPAFPTFNYKIMLKSNFPHNDRYYFHIEDKTRIRLLTAATDVTFGFSFLKVFLNSSLQRGNHLNKHKAKSYNSQQQVILTERQRRHWEVFLAYSGLSQPSSLFQPVVCYSYQLQPQPFSSQFFCKITVCP